MPLTKCPECNGQISTEAPACPHCGVLSPAQHREPPVAAIQGEIAGGNDAEGKTAARPKKTSGMLGWLESVKTSADFRRIPLARMIWDLVKMSVLIAVTSLGARLVGGTVGGVILGAMLLLSLVLFVFWYMLPTVIAYHRDNRRIASIAVVNTVFGWTFVGWVVALSWAAKK
jgi:hypothetical protein